VIVKGCIDDCDICEPELQKSIELDLERKELETSSSRDRSNCSRNHSSNRCCPKDEEEKEDE